MYAIIETGGKQYNVKEGDIIYVEKLNGEEEAEVTFDKVLAVNADDATTFGTPLLEGATVTGKVVGQGKSKKIIVFKFKAKKNYRKKQGHRQAYTKVQIEKITV